MGIKRFLPQMITVVLSLIILICVINIPLGVADGGGQYKTMERLNLYYLNPPTDNYFQTSFGVDLNKQDKPAANTLEYVAKFVIDSKNTLNVKTIGHILSVLLLIGLFIFVRGGRSDKFIWTNYALSGLLVFIFADLGYLTFFNTLYTEGLTLVLLLISIGLLLYCHNIKNVPIYIAPVLAISTLAFSFIGTLQAIVGAIIGVLIIRTALLCDKKVNKYIIAICGVFVFIFATKFAVGYKPVDYEKNIYNSVFFGVANHESVSTLGLNPKLDELKGKFYTDDIAKSYNLQDEFFGKVNYGKITGFYTTHIGAFLGEFKNVSSNAFFLRSGYLGNFTEGSSAQPKEQAKGFNLYSFLKAKFIPNTTFFIFLMFAIYFAVLIYMYVTEQNRRLILEVFIALGLAAATCIKMPIILSGGFELGRALYMFNILFDLMLISALIAGGRVLLERRENLTKKYGIKQ